MTAAPRQTENLNARERWISFSEFLVGGTIVIAHNVYHRVPNEVPILFLLGWTGNSGDLGCTSGGTSKALVLTIA